MPEDLEGHAARPGREPGLPVGQAPSLTPPTVFQTVENQMEPCLQTRAKEWTSSFAGLMSAVDSK